MPGFYIPRDQFEQPFKDMLADLPQSRRLQILNLYSLDDQGKGVGGVGKTRMLVRYIEICKEFARDKPELNNLRYTDILDMRFTENQTRTAIIKHIIKHIRKVVEAHFFEKYSKLRQQYGEIRRSPQEARLSLQEMQREMDDAFVEGLNQALDKISLVLLFDSWEKIIGSEVEIWFENILRAIEKANRMIIVISGRIPLQWTHFTPKPLLITPFSINEAKAYAKRRKFFDDTTITRIHGASQGSPVLIAWTLDYLLKEKSIDEIIGDLPQNDPKALCERLIDNLGEDKKLIAWAACLHRRFNPEILANLTNKS